MVLAAPCRPAGRGAVPDRPRGDRARPSAPPARHALGAERADDVSPRAERHRSDTPDRSHRGRRGRETGLGGAGGKRIRDTNPRTKKESLKYYNYNFSSP
eukprot:4712687-Prymnesium_polylepis.1